MAVTVTEKTKMYDTPENTSINESHGIPSQNPDSPSQWGWQSFLTLINHLGIQFSQIKGVATSGTNPGSSKIGDVWFYGTKGAYPYYGTPVTEFNEFGYFIKGASSYSKKVIMSLYTYNIKDGETGKILEQIIDDFARYNTTSMEFEVKGDAIKDATIPLAAFSQAVLDYIGSGGAVTNQPDERHLDKFTEGTEKLRIKDGFEGKTYLYNPSQYATSADLKTAVEALVAGGDKRLVISDNVDGGGLTWDFSFAPNCKIEIANGAVLSNVTINRNYTAIIANDEDALSNVILTGTDYQYEGEVKYSNSQGRIALDFNDEVVGRYRPRLKNVSVDTAAARAAEIQSVISAGRIIDIYGEWDCTGQNIDFTAAPGCTLNIKGKIVGANIIGNKTALELPDNQVFDNVDFQGTFKLFRVDAGVFGSSYTSVISALKLMQLTSGRYVSISDDYDLGGNIIDATPYTRGILEFNGGKLINGTYKFKSEYALISAPTNAMIFKNMSFTGYLNNKTIYVQWFGDVDNTGTLDASTELAKVIGLVRSDSFCDIHLEKDASYKLENQIVISKGNLRIYGHGALCNNEYYVSNGAGNMNSDAFAFSVQHTASTSWHDAAVTRNSPIITVVYASSTERDNTVISAGDLAYVKCTNIDPGDSPFPEQYITYGALVLKVDDSNVDGVTRLITIDNTILSTVYDTPQIRTYTPTKNVQFIDIKMDCLGTEESHLQGCIEFLRARNCKVVNADFDGKRYAGVGVKINGHSCSVEGNSSIRNFLARTQLVADMTEQRGYGVRVDGCNNWVSENSFYDNRHSVTSVYGSSTDISHNNFAMSEDAFREELGGGSPETMVHYPIDTHESSIDCKITGNTFNTTIQGAIQIRGTGNIVTGNTINMRKPVWNGSAIDVTLTAIALRLYSNIYHDLHKHRKTIVSGNTINMVDEDIYDGTNYGYAVSISADTDIANADDLEDVVISNNFIEGLIDTSLSGFSATYADVYNLKITSNPKLRGGIVAKHTYNMSVDNNSIYHGINVGASGTGNGIRLQMYNTNASVKNNTFYNLAPDTANFGNNFAVSIDDRSDNDTLTIEGNDFYVQNTYTGTSRPHIKDRSVPLNQVIKNNKIKMYNEDWEYVFEKENNGRIQQNYTDDDLMEYTLDARKNNKFKKTLGASTTFTFDISGYRVGDRIELIIWCPPNAGVGAIPSFDIDGAGGLTILNSGGVPTASFNNNLWTNIQVGLEVTDDTAGAETADAIIYITSA